jgi:predicted alpha/beta-hydrolase family hydrolase
MRALQETEFRLQISGSRQVSALLLRPPDATCLLVLAHGAGAGMRHRSMEALSAALAGHHMATFRFQFPARESGAGRPDRQPVAVDTVRAAVAAAREASGGVPLFAGGRSFGGRMTSTAASESPLPGVRGLILFAFPLHPPGRLGTARAEHLGRVDVPMLFLQGTRDALADLALMQPLVGSLAPRSSLHVLDGADHAFHVLKRSGRTDEDILAEVAATARDWTDRVVALGR